MNKTDQGDGWCWGIYQLAVPERHQASPTGAIEVFTILPVRFGTPLSVMVHHPTQELFPRGIPQDLRFVRIEGQKFPAVPIRFKLRHELVNNVRLVLRRHLEIPLQAAGSFLNAATPHHFSLFPFPQLTSNLHHPSNWRSA